MKSKILSLVALGLAFTFAFRSSANEGGGGEGGGEGKKEEGPSGKPWVEVQNRVSALRTKVKQLDEHLHELIEEKKKTTTNARMHELDREIDTTYKAYKENNEELRRQEQIFKYRFPERAAKESDRTYSTQEIPSLEKIEEQVGVEGKLQRNLIRMRQQYPPSNKKKAVTPKHDVVKEAGKTPAAEDDKNIREQDSPILKK